METEGARGLDELVLAWLRCISTGDFEQIPRMLAPAYTRHTPEGPQATNPAGYRAFAERLLEQRPGLAYDVVLKSIDPPLAWLMLKATWRDPVDGSPVERIALQVYRAEDGRLAESWAAWLT